MASENGERRWLRDSQPNNKGLLKSADARSVFGG